MRLAALATLATLWRSSMVKLGTAAEPTAVTAAARGLATGAGTTNPLESAIAKAQKRQARKEQKKAQKAQKQQERQQRQQLQEGKRLAAAQTQPLQRPGRRRDELVVVGLGNVGDKYTMTRHNAGFLVADALAERLQLQFAQQRGLKALVASGPVGESGRTLHIVKPTTMMNLSGESVRLILAAHSLPKSSVLVVVDDVDLPFGALRLRLKGSAGGHNGLRDIERQLGGQDYSRLRVGVGAPGGAAADFIDHVLGEFDREEQSVLPHVLRHVAERCEHWALEDDVRAFSV
jgi:PTH1 family peptidyl-tRNA hydrolase